MLLVSLLLLWVGTAACFAVAWAVRPRPGQPDATWPKWTLPMAGFAIVVMLGAIPAAAIHFSADEESARARGGLVLTADEQRGKAVFTDSCKRCHTLADARAAATIGPNLDLYRPSHATIVDAIVNGRSRGNGQMPRRLVDEALANDVADYIEKVAGR